MVDLALVLIAFPVGLFIGFWAYDHGWRAQSPFYKVYSLDELQPKKKEGTDG